MNRYRFAVSTLLEDTSRSRTAIEEYLVALGVESYTVEPIEGAAVPRLMVEFQAALFFRHSMIECDLVDLPGVYGPELLGLEIAVEPAEYLEIEWVGDAF